MTEPSPFAIPLEDLLREAHVDPDEMVEERAVEGPPVYVDPDELARQRLLGTIEGPG